MLNVFIEVAPAQDFAVSMKKFVESHGAINNAFLHWFAEGKVTLDEFRRVAVEFFHFSREWPVILATLLVHTQDEAEAAELTKILVSELGDGDSSKRHELLFRDFLRSINIDPKQAMVWNPLPTTLQFIEGLKELFSSPDHALALGAEFGLETMATPMWNKLIPGLEQWKKKIPIMDITFFTFHRELEQGHEDSAGNMLEMYVKDEGQQQRFLRGVRITLDLLEQFWTGMGDKHD